MSGHPLTLSEIADLLLSGLDDAQVDLLLSGADATPRREPSEPPRRVRASPGTRTSERSRRMGTGNATPSDDADRGERILTPAEVGELEQLSSELPKE